MPFFIIWQPFTVGSALTIPPGKYLWVDGLSSCLHCYLIELWITFQYIWWSLGLPLLFGLVHGPLILITRWCNITSAAVLLFRSSQPSCSSFSVSCLVYVYTVNKKHLLTWLCAYALTFLQVHMKLLFYKLVTTSAEQSFWVTLTSDNLVRTSAGYEPVQWW